MLLNILRGTPIQIWVLLAGLIALGVSQARARTLGATRVAALPLILVALSLAGVVSSFGGSAVALLAWLTGMAVALAVAPRCLPTPSARWSPSLDAVHVAGSWLPLALILGLFATKYAAGVSLALHPALTQEAMFALPVGLAYGLFSGTFAARGWQTWRTRSATTAVTVTA